MTINYTVNLANLGIKSIGQTERWIQRPESSSLPDNWTHDSRLCDNHLSPFCNYEMAMQYCRRDFFVFNNKCLWWLGCLFWNIEIATQTLTACSDKDVPDNKVHGANMGPTWVLSAPDGPHVGPMNLVIWGKTTRSVSNFLCDMMTPWHGWPTIRITGLLKHVRQKSTNPL